MPMEARTVSDLEDGVIRAAPEGTSDRLQDRADAARELVEELARNAVVDPRSVPVRFSNLKHMSMSPLHYWDAVQLGREDTLAMRLGRGAHAMALGMPVVLWTGKTRQGKEWDRFRSAHADKEILNRAEWGKAEGIAHAIRGHRHAAPLLFHDTVLEQRIDWEWLGKACTSRPDSRRTDGRIVTDLKTTQCARPDKFERDATHRGYHAQLVFYSMAVAHLTGQQPDELYAVAVESRRPFAVTVLRVTDEAREQGMRLCRAWFEQLLVCEATGYWPAYVDHVVDLGVPSDDGELKLTIDGEEYDYDAPENA